MKVSTRQEYFKNESEWSYFLGQLGIKGDHSEIIEVEFDADFPEVTETY